jgi:hypothetical protein
MAILNHEELAVLFNLHTADASHFTRRMAIRMADMDGTTPKDLVLRLERNNLLKRGSWDWFSANGGITRDQIEQVRSEATAEPRQ